METGVDNAQQISVLALSIDDWIKLIVFGAVVGAFGQAIRSVAGIKKVNDAANSLGSSTTSMLDSGRYFRSLLLGAVAGFLAVISTVQSVDAITMQTVLGVMAAGYAGADFVEAFARKHLPEMTPEQISENATGAARQPVSDSSADPRNGASAATDDALG